MVRLTNDLLSRLDPQRQPPAGAAVGDELPGPFTITPAVSALSKKIQKNPASLGELRSSCTALDVPVVSALSKQLEQAGPAAGEMSSRSMECNGRAVSAADKQVEQAKPTRSDRSVDFEVNFDTKATLIGSSSIETINDVHDILSQDIMFTPSAKSTKSTFWEMFDEYSEESQDPVNGISHRTNLHLEESTNFYDRFFQKRVINPISRFIGNPLEKGVISRIVHSQQFEMISGLVITLHTFFIIASTNASMRTASRESWRGDELSTQSQEDDDDRLVDIAFLSFYVIEMCLKIYVFRLHLFFNQDAFWNILDILLIAVSVFGVLKSGKATTVLAMRSTRILKLAKLLRVVRVLRFFKQFKLFVDVLFTCYESLFWAVLLIVLVLLLFAIFFVQMMENWMRASWTPDAPEEVLLTRASVRERFGSVEAAMLTLAKAISGGIDWEDAYMVAAKTGLHNGMVFLCMVAFFSVAIWNLVASVFIESTIQTATVDRDQQIVLEHQQAVTDAKELMELCSLADVDGSGTLSADEFQTFMESDRIRRFFAVRGLDIKNAEYFFNMLSSASDGVDELDLDHFVGSCLRVRGPATSIDLHMFAYEHKLLARKVKKFIRFTTAQLQELAEVSGNILAQLQRYSQCQVQLQGPTQARRESRDGSAAKVRCNSPQRSKLTDPPEENPC
eukprot:TRINITY_DN50784_c0_g1_i1.p1 TRINITY_DN50784_c0_g1~~TRINITY_DN50784_c0_g1_i1.p1  ORF type:complete len:676 (-),score=110.59 TRINITY_DN50784_c0_g1_i1:6-2033(-)